MREKRTGRVTSVEVAAEAGVSQATVARTFSSPHLVADASKEKVRAAAERLGYVPNAIARSLKSQRTNIVGAVVPARSEYWQHLVAEISQQLAERGSQLLLFTFTKPSEVASVVESLRQYRVDGVLLASSFIDNDAVSVVSSLGIPAVAFNHPEALDISGSVTVDNEGGAALLAEHLVETGHRSVAFVGGDSETGSDRRRFKGASTTLDRHGIICPYIAAGSFDYEAGYNIAAKLLDHFGGAGALPDALMVAGDELAFGVIDGLRANGVAVPDDVSVTGFDGLPQASWAGFDITTLVQPAEELIRVALEQLASPDGDGQEHISVGGFVRVGGSTRRPGHTNLNNAEGSSQ
ncbi:MAG: LacI family DNA-binding transcriptional regulator [Acidimicrobiales bacterium]|nr:LacI family DNA-binding transcriptional regulator [Acidimicrobiales bacterium]